MLRRTLALALSAAIVLAPLTARTQSDTGEITITVVDTSTGEPLADARVFLTGAMLVSALTQKSGTVKYTDVPTGIYRVRVMRRGFDGARSNEFEVLGGKDVTVKFALSASETARGTNNENLRVIGTVVVRQNVQINTNDISDESPIRRISDSMLDALDKLAGVSVNQDSNDPDSAVTISLNGHDESQTAISLDGIPLSVPGSATNLRGINTDLFGGASVSFAPTASGLGGGVNFRTLEPTQSWNERISTTYGTYDRWNYQTSVTGSVGPLGIAVMHTDRGGNNPLTFQDYEDSSGLTYPHGGFSDNLGDLVKLRYRIADVATLTGTYMASNGSISQLCTQWVTVLPCGIGPDNGSFNRFQMEYLTGSSLIGNVAFTATAFGIASRNAVDDLDEIVAGIPNPLYTESQSHTNGYAFNASVGHNKHTFTLTGSLFTSTSDFYPIVSVTPYVTNSAIGINAHQLQFADVIKSTDKLNLNFNSSLADTTGVGYSVLGGGGATWRPTGNDTYQLALALGSAQPPPTIPRTFSNPVTARFNCDAGTAIVSGPGDTSSQQQSSTSYNFDWTHLWRTGQITVNAFRQSQIGQTINALVNEAGEPAGYFPSGYLGTIGSTWSEPTICGAAPFNPGGVYVTEPIAGTARVYQGFDLSGRIALGPNVVVLPTYALNSAVLVAADSRLTTAESTSIIGAQLPGRPIHREGITFDAELPHNGFELLANAQYTGSNNNRYLVPYTTVNWGISHVFGPGRLTLFESNAFNAVSGEFSTLEYAEPVPVSGGGVVLFAANPLLPRTISLNYTVAVGKGAPKARSTLAQQARAAGGAGGSGRGPNVAGGPGSGSGSGPEGAGGFGPAGGPGGQGQFRRNVLPPGADPFSLATDNPMCNAQAQEIARPLLEGLRAYVTAYEQKQPLPPTGDYTIVAHATAAGSAVSYWLEIRPQGFGGPGQGARNPNGRPPRPPQSQNVAISGAPEITPSPAPSAASQASATPQPQPSGERRRGEGPERFRAIFACEYIAALTPEQAKAKGIETEGRLFMGYAPGIGIFGVQPRQLPQGGGSLRSQ